MLAVLYLFITLVFGVSLVKLLVPDVRRLLVASTPTKSFIAKIPDAIFIVPSGMVVGMILLSMFNYYIDLAMSYAMTDIQLVKKLGVFLTLAVAGLLAAIFLSIVLKREKVISSQIPEFNKSIGSIVYYSIAVISFTLVASFLMFYTYRITDGILYAGVSIFSDLAPHTAMTSSFGVGGNIPTHYMHFASDGIQYHFFFYFFCGMLEFLGFPIDLAINVPSIIGMVCCFTLLGLLAMLISRRRAAFVIAPILVLFRSSMNFFYLIKDTMNMYQVDFVDALKQIAKVDYWFGDTPYDGWGIWAINVYPNQRHLMLGTAVILLMILLFLPFLRRTFISICKADNFGAALKKMFISKEAWICRKEDPIHPVKITILACLVLICMPYTHGSALIGSLLVLFGMAIFSESRLLYAAAAICAVTSSWIQTKALSGGADSVVSFARQAGFVCEDKTPEGVLKYLFVVTGLTLILAIIYGLITLIRDIIKKKPVYRIFMLLCMFFPLIFAFNFQVSLEMLANHKFIQFTLILVDAFVAGFLANIIVPNKYTQDENIVGKDPHKFTMHILRWMGGIILAAALLVPLTATGIGEWFTYINLNKSRIEVNVNSPLRYWIEENTDEGDVFLTPMWSLNRFFLAGRPSYYGWPYYAWSAGHDTYTRDTIYYWLLTGCNGDINEFRRYCEERGIKYLVFDPEFIYMSYPQGSFFNQDFFSANLKQVAYFPDDYGTIVYQIYE